MHICLNERKALCHYLTVCRPAPKTETVAELARGRWSTAKMLLCAQSCVFHDYRYTSYTNLNVGAAVERMRLCSMGEKPKNITVVVRNKRYSRLDIRSRPWALIIKIRENSPIWAHISCSIHIATVITYLRQTKRRMKCFCQRV